MHLIRLSSIASALTAFLALNACGGNEPEPKTPPSAASSSSPTSSATPTSSAPPASSATTPASGATTAGLPPFKSLASKDEKAARMKSEVMPRLSKAFASHDAKKYGSGAFTCKTCHGPEYKDPHAVLPKLKLSGDGFQKLSAAKPDAVKWMHEVVEPEMAAAMGEKPYDTKTNTGFGCGGCHAVE